MSRRCLSERTLSVFLLILWTVLLPQGSVRAGEPKLSSSQTVYVPAYSHIYYGDRSRTLNLAITLSIRNTDPARRITVTSVTYHNTEGKLVKSILAKPVELGPLESVRYTVEESDTSGGDVPCFIVRWKSGEKVNAPLVESLMAGIVSSQGLGFVLPGQVLSEGGSD